MNERELFANFITQFRKPFDARLAGDYLGMPVKVAESMIREFLANGRIKRISETEAIYVLANRFQDHKVLSCKGTALFPLNGMKLLSLLESGEYSSCRKLEKPFGQSRQMVYLYLEALASIGCVGWQDGHYIVLSKENLNRLGSNVEKGILARLKGLRSRARAA
jgi:hypothetical protein